MIVTEVDMRGTEFLLRGVRDALLGTGGDASHVVADEARLTAVEIANQVAPKDFDSGKRKLERDTKGFLAPQPFENIDESRRGNSGVEWVTAGSNFLVGISSDDYKGWLSADEASKVLHDEERKGHRGAKYQTVGLRGKQHVMMIDRAVMTQGVIDSTLAKLSRRIGRLKASFWETAEKISAGKSRAPSFVSRHFPTKTNICNLSSLSDSQSPSITFGSNATGVGHSHEKIKRALEVRKRKLAARLKHILTGYARDAAQGKRISKKYTQEQANAAMFDAL